MLSESQFSLLSFLVDSPERELELGILADRLGWSSGYTSRVVAALEEQGCVHTRTEGRQKLVSLADIEPVEQLEALMAEYDHVDFPGLVSGSGLRILYYLDHGRTATELAEASGLSRATVYRRLDELQAVGIVGKSKSRYRLNDSFANLASIARGLAHHNHRREARQHAEGVAILWETHDEYLFACDNEIRTEPFHSTGPSLFAEFDIPLLTRDRYHYFRSERRSSVLPADLVCQTLLIDDGPRYRTYCMLLIQARTIDSAELTARAEHYESEADIDLLEVIDSLVAYLETEGDSGGELLPDWAAFKSTAADYEIDV
jgi:DNA-binding MarR family transcriptional regulator